MRNTRREKNKTWAGLGGGVQDKQQKGREQMKQTAVYWFLKAQFTNHISNQ